MMDSAAVEMLECRTSRSRVRTTAMVAALWILVLGGHRLALIGLAVGPFPIWATWFIPALLFGISVVACLRLYFRKGPQVVLNGEGIEDRRQSLGVIRWGDIRQFSIHVLHETEFLSIEVVDPDKYLSRLSRWNRFGARSLARKGLPAIAISFVHLDPALEEVWQFICEHHPNLT